VGNSAKVKSKYFPFLVEFMDYAYARRVKKNSDFDRKEKNSMVKDRHGNITTASQFSRYVGTNRDNYLQLEHFGGGVATRRI